MPDGPPPSKTNATKSALVDKPSAIFPDGPPPSKSNDPKQKKNDSRPALAVLPEPDVDIQQMLKAAKKESKKDTEDIAD